MVYPSMRPWNSWARPLAAALALSVAGTACRDSAGLHGAAAPTSHAGGTTGLGSAVAPSPPAPGPAGQLPPLPRGSVTEAEALRARDDLPPEQRALAVLGGQERWI